MAIAFQCQSCGKAYRVADHLAGTVVHCTECKGAMNVPTTIEKDAAGEVVEKAARVAPKEFVAPPKAHIAVPPMHKPIAPPLPTNPLSPIHHQERNPFLDDEPEPDPIIDDDIPLDPPAYERAITALPSPLTSPQPASVPPPAKPLIPYRPPKPQAPRLLLTDDVANLICSSLLLILVIGTIYFSHRATTLSWLPDDMRGSARGYMFLHTTWEFLMFCILIVPTMLLACALACNWTKWELPASPYLRAAGVASLPTFMLFGVIGLAATQNWWSLIALVLISPFLAVIMLKELMGMKWITAVVACALLLVLMPLAGIGKFAAEWYAVTPAMQSMAGFDPAAVRAARRKHELEVNIAKANEMREEIASVASALPDRGNPASPRPDPYAGKLEDLHQQIFDAARGVLSHTREELEAQHKDLSAKLARYPSNSASFLWYDSNQRLKVIRAAIAKAPSETPPELLFEPIPDRPLAVASSTPAEVSDTIFAFKTLRLRPPKSSKIDLESFNERKDFPRWIVNGEALSISAWPASDALQQRPWVSEYQIVNQLADRKGLQAVGVKDPEVQYGRLNGIGWTRIASRPHALGPINILIYMGRTSNAWVRVGLHGVKDPATVDAIDKFVQGIAEASSPDAPGEDPFAPKYVVERFAGTHDEPTAIFRAGGKPAIEVLREYVERMGDDAPYRAKRLLTELTGEPPKESPAEKPTLAVLMLLIKDAKSSSDKRELIQQLAGIPVDESRRDEVAGMLEQFLLGDDAHFYRDAAGEALAKWWRPHTVPVLLPLLEENVSPASKRQAAMKVLVSTRDRRAVFPIARWIIKEPEQVVAALSEMGPVAEDEVIKVLRDKSPAVRTNAARILEHIGTSKCLPELRRAASDARDPAAAGVAKAAVEMVVSRVRQLKEATTQPTTRAAASTAP